MSKDWRNGHLPSVSTQRKAEPQPNQRKARRDKKPFPPHLEIRKYQWGWDITPVKVRPLIPWFWRFREENKKNRPDRNDLFALLAWWGIHHPQTAHLPVRFISCQPVECGRQVIQ